MSNSAKSTMNGVIQFGLLKVPVKLFAAARQEGSGFNQVHRHSDGSVTKISQKNYCNGCNQDVPYNQLLKGFPQGDDKFVIVEDHEMKAIAPESNAIMIIEKFVPLSEVDPVYFDKSFYVDLNTDKKLGDNRKMFMLFHAQLVGEKVAGLSKFASRGKEHNILIRAVGKNIMIHTLYTADEVRSVECFDPDTEGIELSPAEISLGKMLIQQLSGKFEPTELKDEASDKIAALIARKTSSTATGTQEKPASTTQTTSDDALAQMLAASLNMKTRTAGGK